MALSAAAPPPEDSHWSAHVRETLMQLHAQLHDGTLRLHYDAGRYVLRAAAAAGRDIVLPTREGVLTAPRPPPRSCVGLLSPYTVADPDDGGEPVHVPWAAIARDLGHAQTLAPNACRGCAWVGCVHGWPDPLQSMLDPAAIVVLRLEGVDAFQPVYGWYLHTCASQRLVPVPRVVSERMVQYLSRSERLRASSLLHKYNNQEVADYMLEGSSFNATACRRFRRYRSLVQASVRAAKKRPRAEMEADPDAAEVGTCLVCLEDKPRAKGRCEQPGCRAVVCDDCHAASRGLCPICDRSAINAHYPCFACHRLTSLQHYGYACVACGDHSLCHECYGAFGECLACATRPTVAE